MFKWPPSAPSKDMGNKAGIDMGYTFSFIVGHLPGHDLAKSLVGSTAAAVRGIGFEEPTKPVAVVRTFWNQPQERLQMAGAFRASGYTRIARSAAAAKSVSAANIGSVGGKNSRLATPTSNLGQPEAGSATWPDASQGTGSLCPHDWELAQKAQAQQATATAFVERSPAQSQAADCGYTEQSRLDRGLQRLVSDGRRPACGTIDGPRRLQLLYTGGPFVWGAELEGSAESLPGTFRQVRLPQSDPGGQREPLWFEGSSGSDPIERVVDGAGNSRRVHYAGPSGTERGARANARCAQERNNTACLVPSERATTSYESVGEDLQSDTSTRGIEPTSSSRCVSTQTRRGSRRACELSQAMGNTPRAQQWGDPMARAQALYRGGFYWLCRGAQSGGLRQVEDLFWETPAWRIAGR